MKPGRRRVQTSEVGQQVQVVQSATRSRKSKSNAIRAGTPGGKTRLRLGWANQKSSSASVAASVSASVLPTIESLSEARRHNQELQSHISQKLRKIASEKAENRRVSLLLFKRLTYLWYQSHNGHHHLQQQQQRSQQRESMEDATNSQAEKGGNSNYNRTTESHIGTCTVPTTDPVPAIPGTRVQKKGAKRKRSNDARAETTKKSNTPMAPTTTTTTTASEEREDGFLTNMSKRQREKHLELYQYRTQRRWNRPFFIDPSGSTPKPNMDTIMRQQLETSLSSSLSRSFFFHRSPPWSNKQTKALQSIVQEELALSTATATARPIMGAVAVRTSMNDIDQQPSSSENEDDDTGKKMLKNAMTNTMVDVSLQSGTSELSTTSHNENNIITDADRPTMSFWEKVAKRLQEKIPVDSSTATDMPKTMEECRLHFLHQHDQSPFTKPESLHILERVHISSPNPPDWQAVASSLNDCRHQEQSCLEEIRGSRDMDDQIGQIHPPKQHKQQDEQQQSTAAILHTGSQRRTAWQCFVNYQTKLRPTSITTWSTRQDSILFAYLAAMGPQFCWDMQSAAQLASRLFANHGNISNPLQPPKTHKQLLARANHSLLNPNFQSDFWTTDDERKLVLCMKVYSSLDKANRDTTSDNDEEDAYSNTVNRTASLSRKPPSAINKIAKEFFPHRAATNVSSKWCKRMDPTYSWRSFTSKEDQAILRAVREYSNRNRNLEDEDGGWVYSNASSQEHIVKFLQKKFPAWDAQRVFRRWKEKASNEDMIQAIGDRVLLEKAIKQTKSTAIGKHRGGQKGKPQQKEKLAEFHASDFVLQVSAPQPPP